MKSLDKAINTREDVSSGTSIEADVEGFVSRVFQSYNGRLFRYLRRRLTSEEDVEDIAQEVYFRLARYAEAATVKYPQAFLFRTASNLLKDRIRREKVRANGKHVSLDGIELPCPKATPERVLQSKQGVESLAASIRELNPKCRQAFILHRFSNLTYGEIAERMGISVSMVEKHIMFALAYLETKLRDTV